MRNRIIIIVLSLYVIGCGCPGPGSDKPGVFLVDYKSYDTTYMYDVYSVRNEYTGYNKLQRDRITTRLIRNVDTLEINFYFKTTNERIASSTGFSLINTAYACSPAMDAFSLKFKIDSVVITADTIYNGIEKGKSLNTLFFKSNLRGSVEDLVTEWNSEIVLYGALFNFQVATDKKSGLYTDQELFIKIYKSNGEIIEGATGKFKWYSR